MIKSTIKLDKAKFNKKAKQLEDKILSDIKDQLEDIATYTITISPVDTGAFVTSWSFETGKSGRPRGKSSLNRPKAPDKDGMREKGRKQLFSDISKIPDLKSAEAVTVRNGSPHAGYINYGDKDDRGYFIKEKVISKFK